MPTQATNGTPLVDIRPFMAAFPTGVGVITAMGIDGRPWGMTCTSICSVTLEPPTLLVCLRRESLTLNAVLTSGTFALNLLHDNACSTAKLFASGRPDRFDQVGWHLHQTYGGPHLIDAAHYIADCQVVNTQAVGDHTIVFGEVCQATQQCEAPPLLYGFRHYRRWLEVANESMEARQ